jgi:hypothetical protein
VSRRSSQGDEDFFETKKSGLAKELYRAAVAIAASFADVTAWDDPKEFFKLCRRWPLLPAR